MLKPGKDPNHMSNRAVVDAGTTAGTAGTNIDAYEYLRQIWNDYLQPVHVRLRAAAIGIEYERPRLALSAQVSNTDFASLLDARIKRMNEEKLIENPPQPAIEPPKPKLVDRFNRRI